MWRRSWYRRPRAPARRLAVRQGWPKRSESTHRPLGIRTIGWPGSAGKRSKWAHSASTTKVARGMVRLLLGVFTGPSTGSGT